ncbi:PAS domain S-box protein [Lyngbya aestuarii]|uniref:PAS domain S-box protein n=1 Tax=Lyngbya aestuarii TaxID=118322 RepID=UPI00403DA556
MYKKLKQLWAAILCGRCFTVDQLSKEPPSASIPAHPRQLTASLPQSQIETMVEENIAQLKLTNEQLLGEIAEYKLWKTAALQKANEQLRWEIAERQRVEIALEQERNFVSAVLDTAGALVIVLDQQGSIVRFNQACEQLTGYSFEEVKGSNFANLLLPPSEVASYQQVFQQLITSARELENLAVVSPLKSANLCVPPGAQLYESYLLAKDGSCQLIAWSNTVLRNQAGAVEHIISVGTDITERERTKVALAKSEAWFKALIQESTDMIDVLDCNGNYLYVNPSCQQIIGVEPAELMGKSCWNDVHPDDLPVAKAAFEQLLQHPREPVRVMLRLSIPDNRWIYLEVTGRNLLDVPGVGGIVINSRDITERQQAQERERQLIDSLQAAKDQLQAVLDAVPGSISWISSDLRYEGVNRYLAETFNLQPEDFLGQELGFINTTLRFKEFVAQLFASSAQQASQEMEIQVNGSLVAHLVFAHKYLQGQAAVCVSFDITELKQTEEALRFNKEKFAKAFRCCPNAISISTMVEGRYLEVNDTLLRYLGYQRDELIGKTIQDLHIWVNPQERDRLTQALREQGAVDSQECKFRTKSGEIVVGLLSAEIITLAGEQCLLALTNDITQRKLAEEKLREVAERDRLLGEIAARIRQSLDLNVILNTTVAEVRHFLQADRVLISYMDTEMCGKVFAESVAPSWPSCMEVTIDDDHLREVASLFEQSEVQIIEDLDQLGLSSLPIQYLRQAHVKAALGVSIIVDNQMFGLLVAHQCSGPRRWQSLEVDLLRRLATQVAIAIKQGRLYQQTTELNQQLLELSADLESQVEERTAQLQQKMQELQELNRLKDIFLHAVSHDLRTPVMGILMVLNNLLHRGLGKGETHSELRSNLVDKGDKRDKGEKVLSTSALPVDDQSTASKGFLGSNTTSSQEVGEASSSSITVARSVVERMIQSNQRQLNLINSLLEVHSTQVQGMVVNCSPVKISQLVRAIVTDLEPLLLKNRATMQNRVSDHLLMVNADATQLWRVFDNLITNALKHNPPGVNLVIDATIEELGTMRCAIADDGLGMNQQQSSRLFDLYYRGSKNRNSTGIGLGLYLCRQIIKAHGGEIGVTSSPGDGTAFWFTLPVIQSES